MAAVLTTFHLPDKLSLLIRLSGGNRYHSTKGIYHQTRYTQNRFHSLTEYCEEGGGDGGTWPLKKIDTIFKVQSDSPSRPLYPDNVWNKDSMENNN